MPAWKAPLPGDRHETWTWIDSDGYVLGTVAREGDHWVAQSSAVGRIGEAPNRREATARLSHDSLTRTSQSSEAWLRRAGTTGELLSWAREKKSPTEIKAEVDQFLRETKPSKALRVPPLRKPPRAPSAVPLIRGMITEELARALPRFEFIAHWLATVTKKKENRGRLGLWVRRRGKIYQVVSPVGGGTVTYETRYPALLFDYARRGQLGPEIRDAEAFRGLAFERGGSR
jgi:hypothetical protein